MDLESEDIFADDPLDSNLENNGGEEEEEELTALEVVERIEMAWRNEKFAPELLPPASDIVECLLGRISEVESSEASPLEGPIRKMEVERIRFLISSYLRSRLHKIESYPSSSSNMTPEEARFHSKYKENLASLFKRTVTHGMPGDFGDEKTKIYNKEPDHNLDKTVFISVLEDVEGLVLRDETGGERDEHIDLAKGSQHILRYKDIRDLLQKGVVRLI
ncbi:DNA replication complex GINS protein SLD5 [Lepeophtheirus salmonis]|uniref:DNA replication complex GINS protein SLD5 n=1 Tax=Lepeophtheirus salmonis TaxID=72036 RepID=D3PGI4_LEPSM|nr:DNA replication complex GINS protein SLD5-like [Lepeophtheirus salmonis]ADD24380.1 DNA replication complex GINS protein SLD5 [Lepeophtheirus salmonis]